MTCRHGFGGRINGDESGGGSERPRPVLKRVEIHGEDELGLDRHSFQAGIGSEL